MPNHTPGPWTIKPTNLGNMIETVDKPGGWPLSLAQTYSPHQWAEHRLSQEESDAIGLANARLMAAAPDLLAACEKAAQVMGWMLWDQSDRRDKNEAYAAVRDALDKANAETAGAA